MREIKFRTWDTRFNDMHYHADVRTWHLNMPDLEECTLMQFTGLHNKNGLQEVYEGDIIDEYGNIKGNAYEMDKGENDLLIQGFGTSAWSETEKKGLERGLKYS